MKKSPLKKLIKLFNVRYVSSSAFLVSRPIFRRVHWKVIWIVNPGTQNDLDHYAPRWVTRSVRKIPLIPCGFVHLKNQGFVLIMVSVFNNHELAENPEIVRKFVRDVRGWKADKITFNGVVPAIMHKEGLWPDDDRMIKDQKATLFMVHENVLQVMELFKKKKWPLNDVLVVGCGFTGGALVNRLHEDGLSVKAYDKRAKAKERLHAGIRFFCDDAPGAIENAMQGTSVIVLLSTTGDEGIRPFIKYLDEKVVVISDTHPKITRPVVKEIKKTGAQLFESALTTGAVKTYPRLVGFERDTLPGCVAQAVVESYQGYDSALDFDTNARKVLRARLDLPRE